MRHYSLPGVYLALLSLYRTRAWTRSIGQDAGRCRRQPGEEHRSVRRAIPDQDCTVLWFRADRCIVLDSSDV